MTSAPGEFPRRLTDNPQKWEEYVRTFDPAMVAAAIATPIVLTALAQALTWLLRRQPATGGSWGLLLPWGFVAAMAIAVLVGQRSLHRQRAPRIPLACWVFGSLQALWLPCLGWYCLPELSIIVGVALCALAFHDARYFYDAAWLRVHYLMAWPAFALVLLLVDAAGGPGLLARADSDPQFVRLAACFAVLVAGLSQIVLGVVGAQWYRLDAKAWAHNQMSRQLGEMRREREVIVRSCDFIVQGLTVGQFSHDVASPLSTVSLSVDELIEGLRGLRVELAASGHSELERRVGVLLDAAHGIARGNARLHEMTAAMLRSLRAKAAPAATRVSDLMAAAMTEMRIACARHGAEPAEPVLDLEADEVFTSAQHAAAIGSVLCNGALQNPRVPLQIRGRRVSHWFYCFAIRDAGVAEAGRPEALERVRASLALADPGSSSRASYQGFGVGLTLAKLLLVRHSGWLAVEAPSSGPGLVFRVVLPRVAPEDIPVTANTPERASGSAAERSGCVS